MRERIQKYRAIITQLQNDKRSGPKSTTSSINFSEEIAESIQFDELRELHARSPYVKSKEDPENTAVARDIQELDQSLLKLKTLLNNLPK